MARHGSSGPTGPVIKKFSSEVEIDRALRKLGRRVEQVRALDPLNVKYGDAEVQAAESDIHSTILDVFGAESLEAREHGHMHIWKGGMGVNMPAHLIQARFSEGIPHVVAIVESLMRRIEEERLDFGDAPSVATHPARPSRVFIGHGRSDDWLHLRDFLRNRLRLNTEDFNRESMAGLSTKERLLQMLASTSFAFLVLTAEDQHADGTRHARENVIHEIGLFQGRHGFERAIVPLRGERYRFPTPQRSPTGSSAHLGPC